MYKTRSSWVGLSNKLQSGKRLGARKAVEINKQFTVEPARAFGDSRVQPVVVVGGSDDQQTVVVF